MFIRKSSLLGAFALPAVLVAVFFAPVAALLVLIPLVGIYILETGRDKEAQERASRATGGTDPRQHTR